MLFHCYASIYMLPFHHSDAKMFLPSLLYSLSRAVRERHIAPTDPSGRNILLKESPRFFQKHQRGFSNFARVVTSSLIGLSDSFELAS